MNQLLLPLCVYSSSHHYRPLPPPLPTLCRQCPGYSSSTPSTPSPPTPPPFTCTTSTTHVLCLCCLQPMPDRRSETDLSIPPQKCESLYTVYCFLTDPCIAPPPTGDICGQAYCHMYWGCSRPGCRGCLNLFKGEPDLNQDGNSILYKATAEWEIFIVEKFHTC